MLAAIKGCSLLNYAIKAFPFELHILGYQFCGPGTRLEERLARSDRGINLLDAACHEHDVLICIATISRNGTYTTDNILAERARKRIYYGRFDFRKESCCRCRLSSHKAQDKNRYGFEDEKEEEENKVNTAGSEMR